MDKKSFFAGLRVGLALGRTGRDAEAVTVAQTQSGRQSAVPTVRAAEREAAGVGEDGVTAASVRGSPSPAAAAAPSPAGGGKGYSPASAGDGAAAPEGWRCAGPEGACKNGKEGC